MSDEIQVLNAEADGLRVYVLLSDNRIIMSRELGDKHCAQVHAEQVIKLKLTVKFMVGTLGYVEAVGV